MDDNKLRLIKKEDQPASGSEIQQPEMDELPEISVAEQDEIIRFRTLTAERAEKQAIVYRLIARLQQRDRFSNAA